MKKFLKWVAISLGGITLVVACLLLYIGNWYNPSYEVKIPDIKVEASPARLERGRELVLTLCAECHRDPLTKQLTGRQLKDLPEMFGVAYSRNITKDPIHGIGSWSDGEVIWLIRTGIHPKTHHYIPPWMVKLSGIADEDLYSIVAFLRSDDPLLEASQVPNKESQASLFAKVLTFAGAFKPLDYPSAPIPMPDTTNAIQYGRYLADAVFNCYECHSADFASNDRLHPEKSVGYYGGGNDMPDYDKLNVPTSNLTPDKTHGIGNWTESDFVSTLKTGFRPNGSMIRYPMMRFSHVPDQEISAIYQYLRTIPTLSNQNKTAGSFAIPASSSAGEKLYIQKGCVHCHGSTGLAYADLQLAHKKYSDDAALIDFIKHADHTYPGTVMPIWDGRLSDPELSEIAKHVRSLGQKSGR